jgi:hypothetical protein
LAVRLLDPRTWRLRVAQLAGGALVTLWIWFRAVNHAPIDRAVRDARRARRNARIRVRNEQLEREQLAPDA